jgi:hypothetical protein
MTPRVDSSLWDFCRVGFAMRTSTFVVSLAIIFAANGCGSSGTSSTGTAGAKGSAGSSGAAGADAGTAGADAGAAGSGTAGVGDGGTAGAMGGAGGTVDGGSAGADGSVAACGTSTAAEIGATCNTVDATGPCVMATLGTGTPPTPGGGPIQGGTYDLTSLTVYPTSDAGVLSGEAPRRGTLVIPTVTTGTFTIQMTQSSGATVERQAGTVVVVGSDVMFTPTCPPPGDAGGSGGSAGFTATLTTFTLFEMGDNGVVNVNLYTKR